MALASWLMLGDPAVVWTWSWRRFCAYWARWLEWNAQRQIDEQRREIERAQRELARGY